MSLLQAIQAAAIDPETNVTDLLRMCMILAARLKNEELRKWISQELNGYKSSDDLPGYRIVKSGSFGTFTDGYRIWNNWQISTFQVPEEFHKYIDTTYFLHRMEVLSHMVEHAEGDSIKFVWDKTVAFVVGKYNLPECECLGAYKSVPVSVIAAIIDTVKTRILEFVLEIEKEDPNIGETSGEAPHITSERVRNIFNTTIMANHVGSFEQGGSNMSEGPMFNIGSQHAGRDINQAGEDIYQAAGNLTISPSSSAADVLKIVEAIKCRINESDIGEKNKKKIGNHLENAVVELKDENPDKKSIADSMKQTNEILKEAKTTGETLKDIGVLAGKVAMWLGPYAQKLGLF